VALLARALEAAKFDQRPSACFFRRGSVCDLCLDGLLNVELQFRVQIATPRPRQRKRKRVRNSLIMMRPLEPTQCRTPPPQSRLTRDLMYSPVECQGENEMIRPACSRRAATHQE
jgi:hypothetical protein